MPPPDATSPIADTARAAQRDFREAYADTLRDRAARTRGLAEEADDPVAAAILRDAARRDVLMARVATRRAAR